MKKELPTDYKRPVGLKIARFLAWVLLAGCLIYMGWTAYEAMTNSESIVEIKDNCEPNHDGPCL